MKPAGAVDTKELFEHILYDPNLNDSGDLEAGTRQITVTSKQVTPDYTHSLTLEAPPDARLVVIKVAAKMKVTIDSFGGAPAATKLYYSVEVNDVERISGEWIATGDQVAGAVLDVPGGAADVGSANEYKLYFWVDQGDAVISLVQLNQGWGTYGTATTFWGSIEHHGFAYIHTRQFLDNIGGGGGSWAPTFLCTPYPDWNAYRDAINLPTQALCGGIHGFEGRGSDNQLAYIDRIAIMLRSEQ